MQSDKHLDNLGEIVRYLFFDSRLLRLICLNITFFGLATFYVVWMLQPYWRDQDIPMTAFGLLWAAQSFVVALASKLSVPLEKRYGATTVLALMGLLPIVGYFSMAGLGGMAGIVLGFTFFMSRGLNQVILTDALNSRIPGTFRATANSITSFMFRGIYIITGPIVGLSIDSFGMHITLGILGAVVSVFFLIWLAPLLVQVRDLEDKQTVR